MLCRVKLKSCGQELQGDQEDDDTDETESMNCKDEEV